MRRSVLIAGVLLLLAGFTAAWFTLQPIEPNSTQTSAIEDDVAALPGDQPLPSNTNGEEEVVPQNDPLHPPAQSSGKTETGVQGEIKPGTRPDPGRIETTPGAKPNVENPSVASQGDKPPKDGGETPPPGAGETPALRPFIKGFKRPPGQNLGNTRPAARRISKPVGVKELASVSPKLMQDRRGLYAQYFHLDGPDASKLDTSKPDMVRIDRQVYFPDEESFADLPISLENFAGVWTGFLVIPEQGDYWLFWGADNGGRVELDGETVLLQDGMVRYVEVSTVLTLQPGLHPLRIEFAQAHNNVADWAKCAANFMWVPEGQTKPIPVPPEMLMVPEWMWSDNAPIITSLSQTEGEIGDEITIQGQGLYDDFDYGDGLKDAYPKVTFAGQPATVLEKASDRLKVRVPIGAQTGDVIVYKLKRGGGSPPLSSMDAGLMPGPTDIPSNSYGFKVTTQFGLLAQWYDLKGWSNFGPDVFDTGVLGDAAITRIEYPPDSLGVPTGLKTYAVKWAGRIGIPYTTYSYIGKVSMKPNHSGFVECTFGISGRSPFRVTLNGQVAIGQLDQAAEGYSCKLSLEVAQGSYLGCEIEMAAATEGAADLQFEWTRTIGWIALEGGDTPVLRKSEILPQMYFPPVVPPKPPEILNVKAVWAEGEQPPAQPYDADPLRPSVRVGQEFTFDITDYGPAEIWDAQPTVTIDGIPLAYTVDGDPVFVEQSERTLHCRSTMPDGVGEGKLVARISIVSSEPFLIDVINRGLVAYLYDIPEAFGLNELPDLQPLSCFKVRKDRTINFEDTADFDLPFPAETFVIEWLGGLIIEQEGDYEFICRSDDGMKLWLDDNVVIDANHRQAPAENKATVHLVPGVYRFRMQFFENNQHEVCVLEWRATQGEGEQQEEIIPRQVVPAKAFSLDTHPPFPDKTSTGKRTDGS